MKQRRRREVTPRMAGEGAGNGAYQETANHGGCVSRGQTRMRSALKISPVAAEGARAIRARVRGQGSKNLGTWIGVGWLGTIPANPAGGCMPSMYPGNFTITQSLLLALHTAKPLVPTD